MQYVLLIYGPEATEEPSPDELAAEMAAYDVFSAHIRDRGAYVAGEALHPITTATTVRVRDGRTLTTDGPFAETKEWLGGYYVVEAKDLDEAIDYAARIPEAARGSIEVRPIIDFAAMAQPADTAAAGAN